MPLHTQPLAGPWSFRWQAESDSAWRVIAVPGCWEDAGERKDRAGPGWYRTRFVVPSAWVGQRLWLQFGAVSYHCTLFVNGHEVGSHTGLWDCFKLEITGAVEVGAEAEILLRVEKPASLTHGPDSPSLPGNFALRETLAGFLPYVWGHIFGGVWQQVTLLATGPVTINELFARGTPNGAVSVEATLSQAAELQLELRDPAGTVVGRGRAAGEQVRLTLQLPEPQAWSPDMPVCYTVVARAGEPNAPSDLAETRFGLRALETRDTTLLLNSQPLYPRMILSWGWYPHTLSANPGPERVRADFARLKQLGYNGVKLCLWFPPQYYFDLADELGMLLWVELPMWLPQTSDFFRAQVPVEYERLVRQARSHPSVMLYSLGCELNRTVGPELLGPLFMLVKQLAGDALVRDNSGSGEAYGGLLNEFAEYYDYHFYSELQFFQPLLDYFSPRWRPVQPWVFGEFCDLDTFRDLRLVLSAEGPGLSAAVQQSIVQHWWVSQDSAINPQGARWQFDVPFQAERLRAAGLWQRSAEFAAISERQALLHRKWTLELVRTYREIAGYVITGEADTPISTAGMWDDTGRLKFDPAAFSAFNSNTVLLLGWDKRRAWVAGGDRAAYWDTTSYSSGVVVRPHLIASHYGQAQSTAEVRWSIAFADEAALAQGEHTTSFVLEPGSVRELAVAEFVVPEVHTPRQVVLQARLEVGTEHTTNSWPLWFFPREPWAGVRNLALLDTAGRLRGLSSLASGLQTNLAGARAAIATNWSSELDSFVRAGGGAVLLQAREGPAGPLPTVEMPFWREAMRVVEPHQAWGDFPHDNWAGQQFFGCATDYALDMAAANAPVKPILWRLDARTMATHAYIVELAWGAGKLIVSTLRFEGGHGTQPAGITRNIAASYLLRCLVGAVMRDA